jgi:biopolymer transport protein ExbD/DNA-directed RNA polymerase subunit RPC12/RpoP
MSIEFICQVCGRELKADERAIGRKVRCPDCATLLIIPDPTAAEHEERADEAIADQEAESPDQLADREPGRPQRTRVDEVEEDIRETAPMEVEELQSFGQTPTLPEPSPPKTKKRHRERRRPIPADAESRPQFTVSDAGASPPPLPVPAGATSPPPSAKSRDDATLLLPLRSQPEDLIDMTAMVDIVFFLLIFFLVTSLQALESVMNLPTPQSGEPGVSTGKSVAELENDPNFITVRIEDDDSIWVENTQVFNDQELSLKLRTARQESNGPRSLLVVADADASHGTAVRVFDAGADAGVSGISLIVQERSESSR